MAVRGLQLVTRRLLVRPVVNSGMRLLIISQTNAPWTAPYARAFTQRGDVVKVLSFAPDPLPGVDAVFVGTEPFDKYKNKHLYLTRVPTVRRVIREFRPDVVFAPYIVSNGLTAVLSWRGPLVVSGRGGDVLDQAEERGVRRAVRRRIVRYVCARADLVHVVSPELEQSLARLGVPAAKQVCFPLGVDCARYHPDPRMPRDPAMRIICTRKHEPIYDNGTIIDALARLKASGRLFHCTFVGGAHLFEANLARARAAGLRHETTFIGHAPPEALPDLLRAADMYVSASLSDGTSSALLEALATGLTPVVSDISANRPWVLDGDNGLLFPPRRSDALAAALARAMQDAGLRRRALDRNPARVAADGDVVRNMERMAHLLKSVCMSRRTPGGPRSGSGVAVPEAGGASP